MMMLDIESLTFSSTRARKAGSSNAGGSTVVLSLLASRCDEISGLGTRKHECTERKEKTGPGHQKIEISNAVPRAAQGLLTGWSSSNSDESG